MKIEKCKLRAAASCLPPLTSPSSFLHPLLGVGKLEYFLTHFYRRNCQRVKSRCGRRRQASKQATSSPFGSACCIIDSSYRYAIYAIYYINQGYTQTQYVPRQWNLSIAGGGNWKELSVDMGKWCHPSKLWLSSPAGLGACEGGKGEGRGKKSWKSIHFRISYKQQHNILKICSRKLQPHVKRYSKSKWKKKNRKENQFTAKNSWKRCISVENYKVEIKGEITHKQMLWKNSARNLVWFVIKFKIETQFSVH